jgi:hypothetical protein
VPYSQVSGKRDELQSYLFLLVGALCYMFGLLDFVSDYQDAFWCLSHTKDAVPVGENTNIIFLAYLSSKKPVGL